MVMASGRLVIVDIVPAIFLCGGFQKSQRVDLSFPN